MSKKPTAAKVEEKKPDAEAAQTTEEQPSIADKLTVTVLHEVREAPQLTDMQRLQIAHVESEVRNISDYLSAIGNTREISLAKTKLDEAVMWAKNHIEG